MTPGIIKKLYHTTPVGLTDEDKQEVYPITATSAVYSAPGESSFPNMSLDNILDALNQGYQYMGKATPTTNPGVYNHKVFYLASDPGTYSYFGNIEVSSLTVLKTSGNGWTADVFNITGGGGGGTAAGYIGTTLVQSSPAPQNLGGISQLNLTSGARIYFGETAYIELNQYGFHFSQGIYSDSFVAAGGVGSGGGGGGGGSYTPGNGISIANDEISVKIGTGLAFDANGNLTATGGGGGGTDLAAVWASLTNSVSDAYANTQINISHIPDITTSKISNLETWISGKGFLTSETDPTVPAWAKAQTPSLYIGTTQVQTSSAAQDLTGILSVKASSANASKFIWDSTNNAWHFLGNLYADGWVSAGGIGGNGSTGYTLGGLDDVTITSPNDGEALVYRDGVWVNAVVQGGGGSTVSWGTESNNTVPLTVNGTSKTLLLSTALSGYATQTWVQQQNYLTSQAISTLTLNSGAFSSGSWTPTGSDKTFNIPTTAAHLSYGNGTLKDFLDDLPNNYVTIATTQTITGAKTFTTNPVTIGQTSSLSIHQSSYIDIGPIRIKFENNAIHITKVDPNDNTNYGLYADGFVSAGGIQQTT